MNLFLLTSFALIAFAGNSILCRLALGDSTIDAASFTAIRLLSGVVVLLLIFLTKNTQPLLPLKGKGSWRAATMLFVYAAGFSYAYHSLDTGMGALILFGAVQITMITASLLSGHKLLLLEWLGLLAAFGGFVYLMLPGASAPPVMGFVLMAAAGIAWGFYTLAGKGATNPLTDTTFNFVRTLPWVVVLMMLAISHSQLTLTGVLLAIVSGGLASGIGYTIWYMALEGLSGIQASVLQLFVPVIAAVGGYVLLGEPLSVRLLVAATLILGGILCVIYARHRA